MVLKINLPYSLWEYKISGIYKITFEDGTFYIGCSEHLRQRANSWELIMIKKQGVAGKDIGTKVIEKIRELSAAQFDIVELCHTLDLKDKEAFYLDKNKEDERMLSNADCYWKPVLQYTAVGIFIKRHMSISGAARYNKCKVSKIQRVLNKERSSFSGMKFIYEKDYKSPERGWKRFKTERKKGREIAMFDDNKVEIKRFKQIKQAAEEMKCGTENIVRVLSGAQKKAKGYFFKYVDKPEMN